MFRFDYYAATVPDFSAGYLAEVLGKEFGGDFLTSKPVSPYTNGRECIAGSCRLYYGGENPWPFLVASGEDAATAAKVLRREFPKHTVARADVAYDFIEQGGFDRVVELIEPIVRKAKVRVMFYGDPDPSQKAGRTMYYGSKHSDIRIRVYEKGLEQRGKGVPDDMAPENWIRVELQSRPRKARKKFAASMTEAELFGLSKWSLKAAEAVLGVTVPFTPDTSMRETTTERAIRHMIDQYGSAIGRFVDLHGRKAFDNRISEKLLQGSKLDPFKVN